MHLDTIVAYTYRADVYCPACVASMFTTDDSYLDVPDADAETLLDYFARRLGIDRENEWGFDSENFPKVVFADQVFPGPDTDYCGNCYLPLLD